MRSPKPCSQIPISQASQKPGFCVPEDDYDSFSDESREGSVKVILDFHALPDSVPSPDDEGLSDVGRKKPTLVSQPQHTTEKPAVGVALTVQKSQVVGSSPQNPIEVWNEIDSCKNTEPKTPVQRIPSTLSKNVDHNGSSQLDAIDLEIASVSSIVLSSSDSEDDCLEVLPSTNDKSTQPTASQTASACPSTASIVGSQSKDIPKCNVGATQCRPSDGFADKMADHWADMMAEKMADKMADEISDKIAQSRQLERINTSENSVGTKGSITKDLEEDSTSDSTDDLESADENDIGIQNSHPSKGNERQSQNLCAPISDHDASQPETALSGPRPGPGIDTNIEVKCAATRLRRQHEFPWNSSFAGIPHENDRHEMNCTYIAPPRVPSPSDAALAKHLDQPIFPPSWIIEDSLSLSNYRNEFPPVGPHPLEHVSVGLESSNQWRDGFITSFHDPPPSDSVISDFHARNRASFAPRLPTAYHHNRYQFAADPSSPRIINRSDSHSLKSLNLQTTSEGSSSKLNISNIVNPQADAFQTLKRKADEISVEEVDRELAGQTQPISSADSNLPEAQNRDMEAADVPDLFSESSHSISETPHSPANPVATTEVAEPRHKKIKTSHSSALEIGKFLSGVCVGIAGAFAVFIASIPTNVQEEALREFSGAT